MRDEYHMAELFAVLSNVRAAVAGIHQFVESDNASAGESGQWNGGLGNVQGGRSQHITQRQLAIAEITMQLIAFPPLLAAPLIESGTPIAVFGKIGEHFWQLHSRLPFQAFFGSGR
jgi:hypothetical protein